LTLEQAISLALVRSPVIAAAERESDAAAAAARGASAPINPELLVTPGFPRDAGGSDEELLISQALEVNGSRQARSALARSESATAAAAFDAARREVILRVKTAYWEAARAQAAAQLNREIVKLAESLLAATKRQLEVGTVPGAQVTKTEVELAQARQELIRAEADVEQAAAALGTAIGVGPDRRYLAADPLRFEPISVDANALKEHALRKRPQIAQARLLLDARRAELAAVRSSGRPDIAIQIRKETFDSTAGVGLGISLPILDWGSRKAARQRAEAAVSAQEKRIEAECSAVRLDVDKALIALRAAEAQTREYETGILEKSEQLAQMAEKGYMAGATGYLEVLEAQRTLRNVRMRYIAALAEHAKAAAELEWASGTDIMREESGR